MSTLIKYHNFLASKRIVSQDMGHEVPADSVHKMLFPFQKDLVVWACRKGRTAIFADTGLGKTLMQLEWARLMRCRTLIVAPLTVARQTVCEGHKINMDVSYSRDGTASDDLLTITNYEMVDKFNPNDFGAVVLDESSILKSLAGKTRRKLTTMFADTPYRLCCTATPAPNDFTEIGNHAEFLGVMRMPDMLATFFVHDDNGWRLKGYASSAFYRWLSSWGMSCRMPSDLGYEDDGFVLPRLNIDPLYVAMKTRPLASLFFMGLKGIQHRSQIRRQTVQERIEAAAKIINASDEQWICWCGLNNEATMLQKIIRDAVEVKGSHSPEYKADALESFQDGKFRVLITKPKIAGFGMNFQNCHNMTFIGLSDSWESYYQCIRRCWRFGQKSNVNVHVVLSEWESEIFDNVLRKERKASEMSRELIAHVQQNEQEELMKVAHSDWQYEKYRFTGEDFCCVLGDSVEQLRTLDANSVGLSVFSPPFLSLYTYTPTERDVGNNRTSEEFFTHFGFIITELLRATIPGRNCCVHVSQIPAMLVRDGYIGMKDFRGVTIQAFEQHGWVYQGEVCIDKDPQAQAIRTHAKGLAFKQLKKDASWIRPALADYVLVFRKSGENQEPIVPNIDNDTWIRWARPIWYGIRESDTLNKTVARADKDDRHICPLQLGVITRCIRLWSNEDDLVCDPFAGIGSTGYVALCQGRQFWGCELKRSYFEAMHANIIKAKELKAGQIPLFE